MTLMKPSFMGPFFFYMIKVASPAEKETSLLTNCRNSVELLNLLRLLAQPEDSGGVNVIRVS